MAWLRIDDGFSQHPKLLTLTYKERWDWMRLLCWCARYKTGGRLLPKEAGELRITHLIPKFVDAGMLEERDDPFDGWDVHDWPQYNPADATNADRQARHRNGSRNGSSNGLSNGERNGPSRARASAGDGKGSSSDLSVTSGGSGGGDVARRDELWDVLTDELGPVATKSERGRRNRAVADLRQVGARPEQVRRKIAAYRERWPNVELTALALVSNWSQLDRPVPAPFAGVTAAQIFDAAREAKQ